MASEIEFPAWTGGEPPNLGGRDFLGLQSVGDAMLSHLLPGMTNQTRHPRYYAFFSWAFDEAQKAGVSLRELPAFRFRVEGALLYAAAAKHASEFSGLVGILGVTRGDHAWQGERRSYPLERSAWVKRASAFSAPFYSPSFQQLGLLRPAEHGGVGLLPRGQELAAAFREGLRNRDVLRSLEDARKLGAGGRSLSRLHDDLCPCTIPSSERVLLREMLFRMESSGAAVSAPHERNRRLTLAYLLDLVQQGGGEFPIESDDQLRTLLYYWKYPNGARYLPGATLRGVAEAWRLFQARQYQRYAIESLWGAFCRFLDSHDANSADPGKSLLQSIKGSHVFSAAGIAPTELDRLSVAKIAERVGRATTRGSGGRAGDLPIISPSKAASEAVWKEGIDEGFGGLGNSAEAFANAVGLLLTLWFRWSKVPEPAHGAGFMVSGGGPRISISSMFAEFDRQRDCSLQELCGWLISEYAIGQHLRVSSHKLRIEGIDTFWFYADETGYTRHPNRDPDRARPGYNAPKLKAATSSLLDLGLLKRNAQGAYFCTADGQRMLRKVIEMESDQGTQPR